MFGSVQKSMIKEIATVLPISVVCLNFILMMEHILRFSRQLSGAGASLGDFMYMIVLIQPQILVLTLPMSLFLALLIVYGRMNMDSEIVVMRAVGMSMRQISLPSFIVGLAVFVLTALITFYIAPMSAHKLRMLINRIIETRAPLSLQEGVFHDQVKGITLMIGKKPKPNKMRDIFVFDMTDSTRPKLITSEKGEIIVNDEGDVFFDIRKGRVDIVHENSFTEMEFDRYVFKVAMGLELLSGRRAEKSTFELYRSADRHKGRSKRKIYTEFYRRFTLPLMNLFLMFLAPALSMLSGRTGKMTGFIYGVIVFCAYYFCLIYVENLIHSGSIHHGAAWGPLIVFGAISVYIYRKEARK
jgi:lipopolysaccharide export system permease protein